MFKLFQTGVICNIFVTKNYGLRNVIALELLKRIASQLIMSGVRHTVSFVYFSIKKELMKDVLI